MQKRARRMEKFALPPRERCSSCGADERVDHHKVGAIEIPVPLCRACARRMAEAEEQAQAAERARRAKLRVVPDPPPHPSRPPGRAAEPQRSARRLAVRPQGVAAAERAPAPGPPRPPRGVPPGPA